ncbi:transmembrane protein 61 [Numida meleagris]|uniref:transmembrane protein 61 n=1 Tax=Numida meleagris TaxID=8996 RepID=UPI000B3DE264|nr:transmembrane protein 61 [Numida meleagris]
MGSVGSTLVPGRNSFLRGGEAPAVPRAAGPHPWRCPQPWPGAVGAGEQPAHRWDGDGGPFQPQPFCYSMILCWCWVSCRKRTLECATLGEVPALLAEVSSTLFSLPPLSCVAGRGLPCVTSASSPRSRANARRMAAASIRYGITITGAVLLVTGTLCFAWWSDGEVGTPVGSGARLLPPREAQAVPSSSNALLRSVSFFCCGIGGILLLFGLLWSVKANARVVSRRYQYRFPRDLQYFTAEPPEKWNCSSWDATAIPTYEEALTCRPAHGTYLCPVASKEELTPPPYHDLEEEEDERWQSGRRRSSSDSALFRPSPLWLEIQSPGGPQATPPPSYENISVRDV